MDLQHSDRAITLQLLKKAPLGKVNPLADVPLGHRISREVVSISSYVACCGETLDNVYESEFANAAVAESGTNMTRPSDAMYSATSQTKLGPVPESRHQNDTRAAKRSQSTAEFMLDPGYSDSPPRFSHMEIFQTFECPTTPASKSGLVNRRRPGIYAMLAMWQECGKLPRSNLRVWDEADLSNSREILFWLSCGNH